MTKFKQGDRVVPDCDNTVIEVLTIEHGQLVKQYWEGKGVEVGTYAFDCNKNDDNVHRYYGFVNGNFSNWQLSDIRSAGAKIIELPSSALRPASPKWDPKVGEEVGVQLHSSGWASETRWKLIGYSLSGRPVVECFKATDDFKDAVGDIDTPLNIRPIAPSLEEELRHKILESVGHASVCWGEAPERIFDEKEAHRCADDLFQFVIQWHNRHKEGGANDND